MIVSLPDGRQLDIPTSDPKRAATTARQFLAREAIQQGPQGFAAKNRSALTKSTDAAVRGFTLGLSDVANAGITAAATAVKNAGTRAMGGQPTFTAGDAYTAQREIQRRQNAQDAKTNPLATGFGSVVGGLGAGGEQGLLGPLTKFAAKGMPAVGAAVENVPVVGGLLKGLASGEGMLPATVRALPAGAAGGAIPAAVQARPGQKLAAAQQGAKVGAATTLAAAPLAAVAGPAIKTGVSTARNLGRAVNAATGGRLIAPEDMALRTLRDALVSDGATPQMLHDVTNQWLKTGASTPSLLDVVQKLPSGGQNTLRLLTGATMKGGGAGVARQYADTVAGNLQQNAIDRTRALVPGDTREIPSVQADTAGQIQSAAQQPVRVTPGTGGEKLSQTLNTQYDTAADKADAAFTHARQIGNTATLHPDAAGPLSDDLSRILGDYRGAAPQGEAITGELQDILQRGMPEPGPPPGQPDLSNIPEEYRQMLAPKPWMSQEEQARRMATLGQIPHPPGAEPVTPDPINMGDIQAIRQRLSALQQGQPTPNSSIAGKVKAAIDQHLDAAQGAGHIIGDPEAVDAWNDAINLRRYQGGTFESKDLQAKLAARGYRGGDTDAQLVAPEDTSDAILGSNDQNVRPGQNMVRDLTRLRAQVGGPNAPEWRALQDEAASRLTSSDAGTPQFGQRFQQWRQDNPDLADLLIHPDHVTAVNASQDAIQAAQGQASSLAAGQGGVTRPVASFASDFSAASDPDLARLGMARSLEDKIRNPGAGQTKVLNNLATNKVVGPNVETAFGSDAAGDYQAALSNEIDRMRGAHLMDPHQGSPTVRRADALAAVELPDLTLDLPKAAMSMAGKFVRGSLGLSDAEKTAIAKMGTTDITNLDLSQFGDQGSPITDAIRKGLIYGAPSAGAGVATQ